MDERPRMQGEPTTWSPGLIGFYVSCAAVGIGAAVAAVMLVVFPGEAYATSAAAAGILIIAVGGFASWRFLKSARRES